MDTTVALHTTEPYLAHLTMHPPILTGAVVLVHDAEGIGQIPYGKPMPLVLAAMRSSGANPHVELVVKASEAMSLYNRTANRPAAALETAGVELEKLEAGVQLEKLEAVGGP